MDSTTEGCVASLKDACGEKNKRWRPFWDASYRCVEFSLWFSQEACNDVLHKGHVINYVLLSLCDAMYDFAYLSVRRSVRDSHCSSDYRDGTGIRIFYENPGFYSVVQWRGWSCPGRRWNSVEAWFPGASGSWRRPVGVSALNGSDVRAGAGVTYARGPSSEEDLTRGGTQHSSEADQML
jgi:hypothetical protein